MSRHVSTIVIGGGVAGLACSTELHKQGIAHILIADEVGGRITSSTDGAVNYGAYILGGDNRHLQQIVTRGRRLRLHRVRFHGLGSSSFWSAWKSPIQLWRFYRAVRWFQQHYHEFQRQAENLGQREALLADKELYAMYLQSADTWLRQHRLREFTQAFIDPIIRMCTFSEVSEVSALEFFHLAMYLTIPVYEFTASPKQLTANCTEIVKDIVVDITVGSPHVVHTKNHGTFTADALVLATPIDQSLRWLTTEYDKKPRQAWMYHLQGAVKKNYAGADLHIFRHPENNLFLSPQKDGTFLCYRLHESGDFSDLFEGTVDIKASRQWKPAFWMGGTSLKGIEVGKNVFLAGDHNIVGMEDAYVSGIAAAKAVALRVLKT